jgi:hypothetical protein
MPLVIKEETFPKALTEKSLTAEERKDLTDEDFGIPEEKKFPIHDADHVRAAVQMFRFCPKAKREGCAKRIVKAAGKLGVDVKSALVLKCAGDDEEED